MSKASSLKITKVKFRRVELLTVFVLLMVENGIRVGICHAICRSAKANKSS